MKKTLKVSLMIVAVVTMGMSQTVTAKEKCCLVKEDKAMETLAVSEQSFEHFENLTKNSLFSIPSYKVSIYGEDEALIMEKEIKDPFFIDDAELKAYIRKSDFIVESNGTYVYKLNANKK